MRSTKCSMSSIHKVLLCGGSGGNHVLAADLGRRSDYSVSLLTNKPEKWNKSITCNERIIDDSFLKDILPISSDMKTYSGNLHSISPWDDIKSEIENTDTIILTCPVSSHRDMLNKIIPNIPTDRPIAFGTLFAQGGFDWIVRDIMREHNLSMDNISIFGFQRYPFACKPSEYGKSVDLWGRFPTSRLAVSVGDKGPSLENIKNRINDIFDREIIILPSFLYCTFNPSNQVLHPGVSDGMFHNYEPGETVYSEIPKFYANCNYQGAKSMSEIGVEMYDVAKEINLSFEHLLNIKEGQLFLPVIKLVDTLPFLRPFFVSILPGLVHTAITKFNKRWDSAPTPMIQVNNGFIPNFAHRFWLDDIPHGLCVIYGIAEIMNVSVPSITNIIKVQQKQMGKEYITDTKINGSYLNGKDVLETNAPQIYGIRNQKDLKEFYSLNIHNNK